MNEHMLHPVQFGFGHGTKPKRTESEGKVPSGNFGFNAPDRGKGKREGDIKNTPTLYEGRRRKS